MHGTVSEENKNIADEEPESAPPKMATKIPSMNMPAPRVLRHDSGPKMVVPEIKLRTAPSIVSNLSIGRSSGAQSTDRSHASSGSSGSTKSEEAARKRLIKSQQLSRGLGIGEGDMPPIDELTTELNISAEHLESCKRQTYQRTFRLWMPMVHDFNAVPEDDDAEIMTEVLPVDELLDRVMLRRVRVSAVERSILFLLFNFLYCACLIMQRSLSDSYELESALKIQVDSGRLKFSTGVTSVEAIWDWMQTSLTDNLAPATNWYNGDAVDSSNTGYTSYYNKQCGGFSLVQHRVQEYSSNLYTPYFHKLYPTVWPDLGTAASTSKTLSGFSKGDEHRSFGPPHDTHKYQWTADSSGEFEGGGYQVYFPTEKKMVLYKLEELKADRFIDKQTRKLQFIVTVFNANLKLFAVIDFQVFLDAAGRVSTKKKVSSVRINNFVDFVDYIRCGMEVLLVCLMLQHTRKEMKTARQVGVTSYLNFWNVLDAARQGFFYVCVVMYVILMADPLRNHPEKVKDMCDGGHWVNFPRLAKAEEDYVFNSALCLLMSTMLIFKFLTPFPKFGIFVHTMVAAGKDLINFVMILSILLFGFAVIGHMIFGHVMKEYATVSACFESSVLNAIGIFDYPAMVEASSPHAAAIYFFSFVFIITMVVMQMVIAIIFSAYDGLQEQIEDAEELEIGPTLVRKLILGRDPSLKELEDSIFDVLKNTFLSLANKSKKWVKKPHGVTPMGSEGEEVTPDTFSDNHLLQLFDPQQVFRMYGILSPKMEAEIVNIKVRVASEREAAAKTLNKFQKIRSESSAGRNSGEEEKDAAVVDTWAMDREEFCALVHALDEEDTALHITNNKRGVSGPQDEENSNAMLIAHHIFSAYGRQHQGLGAGEGKFRKRVIKKLDKLTKIVDATKNEEKVGNTPFRSDPFLSGAYAHTSVSGSFDGAAQSPQRKSVSDAVNVNIVAQKRKQRLSVLITNMDNK